MNLTLVLYSYNLAPHIRGLLFSENACEQFNEKSCSHVICTLQFRPSYTFVNNIECLLPSNFKPTF